ncbi:MAG: hypothetical protein AAF533_26305 [Acidobacteriota bacterium]
MARRLGPWPVLLLLAGLSVSCGGGPPSQTQVGSWLGSYFDAVQSGDHERVATWFEGCVGREEECEGVLAATAASVSAQRELGDYRFDDPEGFGLITAFVLGRGGFWRIVETRVKSEQADEVLAFVEVRTHYTAHETEKLPRGALVEYLVEPLGKVQRIEVGSSGPGALRDEVKTLTMQAAFRKGVRGWRLASFVPVRESVVYEQVIWRPE